jgi:hypothetical protein
VRASSVVQPVLQKGLQETNNSCVVSKSPKAGSCGEGCPYSRGLPGLQSGLGHPVVGRLTKSMLAVGTGEEL